ncbi:MAG: PqqD family protein [Bacteroidia bacterium]|nr:PqqD family protein [Bacteroidia bacterium]
MKLYSHLRVFDVGDQHLLLNTGGRTADMTAAFGINETAAWLLRQMEGKEFVEDELVEWLCGEYEVDADIAREDVEKLLAVLREHSLLID